jgi:hypothetical protein
VVVLLFLASFPTPLALQAQPPGGVDLSRRPAVSPYLNMGRGGNPAVNYYGLVRPQIAFRQSLQQLEQEEAALATQQQELVGGARASGLPATGHGSGFLTHTRYFMNAGRPGAAGPGPVAASSAAAQGSRGAGSTRSAASSGASGPRRR